MNTLLVALALLQARPGGPGEFKGELRDKQGALMRVSMWAPAKPVAPSPRTLSLLLVYHGMNGNENNYYGGTLDALRRNKVEEQVVMIAGKSKGAGWTVEDDGPITLRVIDWAKETWPIDPRRIYIWGSSNGAGFIGRFGWANQDKIAAAVGYCGGYNFQANPKPEDPADTRTEWYFVHGGADNPQNSGNACKALGALGYRYVFRQLDGYGHTDIWDGNGHPDKVVVDACRDDYLQWLLGIRHKTIEPPQKDVDFLAKFENGESLLAQKAAYLNLQRIGGPQAGAVILKALQSKSAGIRANGAEACLTTSFGKAVASELAKLVDDENDRVQQTALRALGVYANWHYPEAIEALCRAAAPSPDGKKGSALVRMLAVEGLSKVAKLAALGNYEDKKLWWALLLALDDEDVKVRTAAFTGLQAAQKDGFGYQPGAIPSARKEAVAKCAAFIQQKCGPAEK
jgi:predicted esterase